MIGTQNSVGHLDTVLLMEVIRDELWTSNNPYHKTEALPKGNLKGVFSWFVCVSVYVSMQC
jgi:hypothetical protein